MTHISTVFFDLDDTLFNHTAANQLAVSRFKKQYFPDVLPEKFNQIWREKTRKNWQLFMANKLSFEEQRTQRIIELWQVLLGQKINTTTARAIFQEFLAYYEESWAPLPNVHQVFQQLVAQKIAIGIITNGGEKQQRKKIKTVGLLPFLTPSLILISEVVGIAKPNAAIFQHAQQLAKVRPEHILIVGNDFTLDIEPAQRLGWQTLLIDHVTQPVTNSPELVLERVLTYLHSV